MILAIVMFAIFVAAAIGVAVGYWHGVTASKAAHNVYLHRQCLGLLRKVREAIHDDVRGTADNPLPPGVLELHDQINRLIIKNDTWLNRLRVEGKDI